MKVDLTDISGFDWPEFSPGLVWLVGAGPGSAGLLTLEALHALQSADVIIHDALIGPAILNFVSSGATLENAGKRGGKASPKQGEITKRLIDLSREGKRVLRLKGGDPFVFGRGGEEAQVLAANGIPFRVTPGVTAGVGGLASVGIPLTHRDVGSSVTFLTGHDETGDLPFSTDWEALAKASPVLIFYMAIRQLRQISAALISAGRDPEEPMAVVSNATLPEMRVLETSLEAAPADVEAAGIKAPAIVCLGRNVLLRQAIDWAALLRGEPARSLDPLRTGNPDFQP